MISLKSMFVSTSIELNLTIVGLSGSKLFAALITSSRFTFPETFGFDPSFANVASILRILLFQRNSRSSRSKHQSSWDVYQSTIGSLHFKLKQKERVWLSVTEYQLACQTDRLLGGFLHVIAHQCEMSHFPTFSAIRFSVDM